MGSVPALRAALDLLYFPSQAALLRAGPLPQGVPVLLRIAAGDEETIKGTAATVGRSCETVREAAAFFLEQILLHPDADSYRVLGATSEARHAELRQNMSLLLQWVHPDLDRRGGRSVFAARVTRAWNDLKTPERRAAYDRARRLGLAKKSSLDPRGSVHTPSKEALARRHIRNRGPHRHYPNLHQTGSRYPELISRIMFLLFGR
jgi:hypothetical protein